MQERAKCLVLGANGFIGSHLVDELTAGGYGVRALDRFSRPVQFRESNRVEVFKADIFDDLKIVEALEGMDYVFHAFSATTPFTSDTDPYTDISQNLLRNVQMLEMIVEAKVKKMVFISSGGAVYGHIAEEEKVKETDAPNPVSPYGIAKLATENYLAYFNRKYGLDYVVYRLTNPYGPRQVTHNNQGVVPAFLYHIQHDEEIVIYGDGTSSRDFIYIGDAVSMITDSFDKRLKYATYNIGSGQQTNLNTIIKTIEDVVGMKAKVRFEPAPKTFLKRTLVSTERFEEEFGIKAPTGLEAGLKLMIG